MPMDKLNIANIARGSLLKRADVEIETVLKNILDKNTDWRKARKVTLELSFKPADETRENVYVDLKAKSTVQPYNPVTTQIFVGTNGEGQVMAEEYIRNKGVIPGQTGFQVDTDTGEIVEPSDSKTGRKIVNMNR